jgi:hypothetical protein
MVGALRKKQGVPNYSIAAIDSRSWDFGMKIWIKMSSHLIVIEAPSSWRPRDVGIEACSPSGSPALALRHLSI